MGLVCICDACNKVAIYRYTVTTDINDLQFIYQNCKGITQYTNQHRIQNYYRCGDHQIPKCEFPARVHCNVIKQNEFRSSSYSGNLSEPQRIQYWI